MRGRRAALALWAAVAAAGLEGCAPATRGGGEDQPPVELPAGGLRLTKPVTSWQALRTRNVVMQTLDYSCGAAALATLMRHYFEEPTTEAEVLADMLRHVPPEQMEKVRREGFSLLDLRNFAQRRGYRAAGVRIDLADLPRLRGPVLVYLELTTSRHFAVLRGVREDRVYLADPARGNLRLRLDRFAAEWPSGIVLALEKPGFGTPADTPLAVEADAPFRIELQAARQGLYAADPGHLRIPPPSR